MPSLGVQELNDSLKVARLGGPEPRWTQPDAVNSIVLSQWGDLHSNSLTSHSRRLEGYNFGSFAVFFLFLLTIFAVISWLLRCCQHFVALENIRSQQRQHQHGRQQSSTDALSANGMPTAILIRREGVRDAAELLELNEALKKSREEYVKSFLFTKDASVETICQDQKCAETVEGTLKDPASDLEENAENCCSICLDEYAPGDKISRAKNISSCQHLFHEHCIISWLMNNDNCPICRISYFAANIDSNEDAKEAE